MPEILNSASNNENSSLESAFGKFAQVESLSSKLEILVSLSLEKGSGKYAPVSATELLMSFRHSFTVGF